MLTTAGQRLTRFRIPHSRAGLEELLRRTTPGLRRLIKEKLPTELVLQEVATYSGLGLLRC